MLYHRSWGYSQSNGIEHQNIESQDAHVSNILVQHNIYYELGGSGEIGRQSTWDRDVDKHHTKDQSLNFRISTSCHFAHQTTIFLHLPPFSFIQLLQCNTNRMPTIEPVCTLSVLGSWEWIKFELAVHRLWQWHSTIWARSFLDYGSLEYVFGTLWEEPQKREQPNSGEEKQTVTHSAVNTNILLIALVVPRRRHLWRCLTRRTN